VINVDNIETLVDAAADAIAKDKERKPVTGADGCWRFDRVLDEVFGKSRDREFFIAVEKVAMTKLVASGGRRADWSSFDLVHSYASTKAAFMTPGFAEARSKWMT